LNGTHHRLVHIILIAEKGYTCHKNTEALLFSMKDVGLNLNADESTCVFMSCEANVEQIYKAKIANQSIETVENFKCSGVKL
jgi:hypothetical protein